MSGRIFQNIVLQLKENTDRTVGVIDGEGVVIACSELSMIGQRWSEYVAAVNGAAGSHGLLLTARPSRPSAAGATSLIMPPLPSATMRSARPSAAMATVALNAAKSLLRGKA